MSEYTKPTSEKEFNNNFSQKKPLMNETEAFYESSRCLFCYDAPCIKACPTHIDIPLFIKQIQTKNIAGSASTIYETNWLGNSCAKVCPTGVLCEGACVYNNQNVKPIEIGRLQNYATQFVIRNEKKLFNKGLDNGKKVAIIGAGPAGIACASELCMLGYSIDIFEAKQQPSGLTVHGVAPYKITNEEALLEIDYLQKQLDFKIHYNMEINSQEKILELEKNYDAIFLGVGLGKTKKLALIGEELEGIVGAVEFIENLRKNKQNTFVGGRVIILGGGNTAMDAASETSRMGAQNVTLAYRKSKLEMGAYKFEYELALTAGVNSIFNISPLEIIGNKKVEGVKFIRTKIVNNKSINIVGSEFILECDMLIMATGQEKNTNFFDMIGNLEVDRLKRVVVNPETYQTKNKKYFAGGDAINGGAEVVNAAFDGKMAALGIHKYLAK